MNTIKAIFRAINKINQNAQISLSGTDISAVDTIVWENGTQPINKQQILDLIPKCLAEITQEEIDKKQAEQSAINKLKALGLTDAEVEAFRK